jgi:T5SS/PEP-CTERM-associated repeat protein
MTQRHLTPTGDAYIFRANVSRNPRVANFTIGTNGSFTLLILTNNATLSNASTTFIGLNASAKSNAIVVTGPGSAWSINAAFSVGVSGAYNQLSVLDAGLVSVTGGAIGANTSSSNNLVLVSGAGSLWTNSGTLYVGQNGRANQLVVSNGGTVFSGQSYIGYNGSACTNNIATITGTGSLWRCSSLRLGDTGNAGYNQLVIANGGAVSNGTCTIGSYSQTNTRC